VKVQAKQRLTEAKVAEVGGGRNKDSQKQRRPRSVAVGGGRVGLAKGGVRGRLSRARQGWQPGARLARAMASGPARWPGTGQARATVFGQTPHWWGTQW
jgi:hypothetical protein